MARKKDLGGLAALAGLAYMASRDKAGKGGEGPTPSTPSVAPAKEDTGGDFNEAGSGPAPAADENYGNEGRREGPMAIGKTLATAKPKPVVAKAPSNPDYGNEGRRPVKEATSETAPDAVDVTKLSLAERAKLSRERARSDGTKTDSRSVNERFRDSLGMKKGGSVKGWGIARGSRKAKTY